MDDLIDDFLAETAAMIDTVEARLVAACDAEAGRGARRALFRLLHSIKGSCGFLGFDRLGALAHLAEDFVDPDRPDAAITEADLAWSADLLARLRLNLAHVAQHRAEPETYDLDLVMRLAAGKPAAAPADAGETADLDAAIARLSALARLADPDAPRPVAEALRALPAIAEATARACGKNIDFEFEADAVKIPRRTGEAIKDALVHIVRNAVDHGVEPAAARAAAGKPVLGRISVTARETPDGLEVEARDDGRGVDPVAIAVGAAARGLVSAREAAGMDRQAALAMMFAPGLSTASHASMLSGRGVGLDTARDRIEALGGRIEVASSPGEGAVFTLFIPRAAGVRAKDGRKENAA